MRNRPIGIVVAVLAFALFNTACGPDYPTGYGGGFFVETLMLTLAGPPVIRPSVSISGNWQYDYDAPQGNGAPWTITTGYYPTLVTSGRAPAQWRMTWNYTNGSDTTDGPCRGNSTSVATGLNLTTNVVCFPGTGAVVGQGFAVAPNPLYVASPPSFVTITGAGISSQYGMPLLQYFDRSSGTLVAQTSAFSVAADGSSLQAQTPGLGSVPDGIYVGFVNNANASGGWNTIGAVEVGVVAPEQPPPDFCDRHPCLNR